MNQLKDICIFLLLTVSIILLLTMYNFLTIILIVLGLIKSTSWIIESGCDKMKYLSYMNWFEVSKLLGGLAGVIAITYYRYNLICPRESHAVIAIILGINMAEAILSDLINGGSYNAVAGIILLRKVPWTITDLQAKSLAIDMHHMGIFLFPVHIKWICCYTTWNAAFSYGFNYSLSTRLILISSMIVSLIYQQYDTWLGARTYGLVINMILRLAEFTYLYKPGMSIITNRHNRHNSDIRYLWGICNCIICFVL